MHGKKSIKTRLYVVREWSITILIYLINWHLYKFSNISVNFVIQNVRPHFENLKTSDIRCLNWNTAIMVVMKNCKSRPLIPMFIGTPCSPKIRIRKIFIFGGWTLVPYSSDSRSFNQDSKIIANRKLDVLLMEEYSSKRRAAPLRLRNIYGQPKSGGRGVVKN